LRFGASGHRVGDARNLTQAQTAAYGSVRTAVALSATSAGAVSVNAHTVRYGGVSVSYNAVANAVTGLTVGVKYAIYCQDPGYSGGTKTYAAATSADAAMNISPDVVLMGEITIPSSGTSTGGGSGSGGGGWCVDADMILATGRRAGDVRAGEEILVWNEDAANPGALPLPVECAFVVSGQPCRDIVTESGASVIASEETPMTLRDGRSVTVADMLGEDALVRRDDGSMKWERVVSLEYAGLRRVAKISVHQTCYFAGRDSSATIATHNALKP
jgi:hypothetical protein